MYTTVSEIKTVLGISGTSQDTLIGRLGISMENVLNNLLGVDTLDYSSYTEEIVTGCDERYFDVKNQPVVSVSAIEEFESGIAYTGWTVEKTVGNRVYLDRSHGLGSYEYLVSYIAGYQRTISSNLRAVAVVNNGNGTVTLGVTSGHTLASGDTVVIAGTTNYNGTFILSSVGADTVTFPATYVAETTATDDTIVGDHLPPEIKLCVAYLVAGAMSDRSKMPGVSSYSLLGKSMNFRTEDEYSFVKDAIAQYAGKFQSSFIVGI